MSAVALLVACVIEAALAWPGALFARIGHPVSWLGRLIAALDRRFNQGAARRAKGALAATIVIGTAASAAALLQALLPGGVVGALIAGVLAWPLVAARSLDQHVSAVAKPLAKGDLAGGRAAVSMIVGRDVARLDEAGVARAALESLAENASDGVTAPLFWAVIGGLPGIAAYKAINTLDSMIGYKTERHRDFGLVAAKLDDVVNWPAARLTGLAFCAVAPAPRRAYDAMRADAPKHRSPNAGWPEAAMAGALDRRLAGPRLYGESLADEPWLHGDGVDPSADDLRRGLALYRRAMALIVATAALAAWALWGLV